LGRSWIRVEEFTSKFQIETFRVLEFEHWVVSVRPQQVTVGSLILSLKRPCAHMGDMSGAETEELALVFARLESLLAEVFGYTKINYLCLMMVDEQVHFHVLPRYKEPVVVMNREFVDAFWPGPVDISKAIESEELTRAVHEMLVAATKSSGDAQ